MSWNKMRSCALALLRLRPISSLRVGLTPFTVRATSYPPVYPKHKSSWRTANVVASAAFFAASFGVADSYATCDSGTAIESETGVAYESTTNGGRVLAGTSARLMGGIVRVYAVGLYVVPTTARKVLSDHTGKTATELENDESFWQMFCANAEPMLRLVVVREVTGYHMCTGFERGLARAAGTRRPSSAAKRFAKLFRGLGTMKVGSVMEVECVGDTVRLVVDERFIGEVKDGDLVRTICGMYLSEKAVTPNLRVDAASGIANILATSTF